MPWNDQKGGGPWGGGPAGGGGSGGGDSPWGKPKAPGGGGQTSDKPDLEESLKRMQERFKRRGGSGGGSGGGGGGVSPRGMGSTGLLILLGVGLVGWLMTGIYQVNEQESAVVLRFGKVHRTEGPGVRFRFPNPIETARIVPINRITETAIGEREEESLMLTGDENIVDIDFSINWKVNVPEQYLFNVAEPGELIRQVGESAMREVVGTSQFEPITTGDRTGVETRVRDLMQSTLNTYQSGIEIVSISLKGATAPAEVVDVQRDVSNAEQDRAKRINEATAYRNKVVPEARGQAQRMIQEAEAYRESSVANAEGEAARFSLVYTQYQKAPRVTRERMFLETMEGVLGKTDKIILDSKAGAVPYLPLDQLRGRKKEAQ
ncbi:MAG: FtsH protease activity modulator HflK [Alphaproteobacteria bacterium]|nr:FtsH protease activity modulator HflK [Alphaproteobacteria bacterium]